MPGNPAPFNGKSVFPEKKSFLNFWSLKRALELLISDRICPFLKWFETIIPRKNETKKCIRDLASGIKKNAKFHIFIYRSLKPPQ